MHSRIDAFILVIYPSEENKAAHKEDGRILDPNNNMATRIDDRVKKKKKQDGDPTIYNFISY